MLSSAPHTLHTEGVLSSSKELLTLGEKYSGVMKEVLIISPMGRSVPSLLREYYVS